MSPRKNEGIKGKRTKRTKRTKVTHTPVSDAGESSRASTQDTQPASHSTLGKRNRPVVPDSDDEWVTDDETEDGSAVLSNPTTDSDLDDNVTVQPPGLSLSNHSESDIEANLSDVTMQQYWLLLSHYSEPVSASVKYPPTYGEILKTLDRLYQDYPSVLERAHSAPPNDLFAKLEALFAESEALIAKLEAFDAKLYGVQEQYTKTMARRMTVFNELERISGPRPYDAHNLKLTRFLTRIHDRRAKLRDMEESHRWV
ncbi:hypothetical protein J4E85_011232 [Alternaria conjuncta]|uniref:uncharacterized protein n=1 Tax=Alternaria conjuncta TaxID=181017 RepID=UPI0022212599|nr:uncharacterized protein J4E85_011232 [Alternaria conjuncta]KAI4911323.1 hypothetical protein J4E85_011232 [Alternaria conjuncta]